MKLYRCMGGSHCTHMVGTCTATVQVEMTGVTPDVLRALSKDDRPVSFGIALLALKMGKRVTRTGWNGKGMYLYYVPAGRYPPTTQTGHELASRQSDYNVPYRAYVAMKTVDNDVVPWVCSQSDLLEDDWLILS